MLRVYYHNSPSQWYFGNRVNPIFFEFSGVIDVLEIYQSEKLLQVINGQDIAGWDIENPEDI